jgi:hypothetical protein
MWIYLFVYCLRGFRKYLLCVQNILQTDESTIICMIFGKGKGKVTPLQGRLWPRGG